MMSDSDIAESGRAVKAERQKKRASSRVANTEALVTLGRQRSKRQDSKVKRYLPERATVGALRKCAEWLAYCLSIGWRREQLDALEALWWQHHDRTGRLSAHFS